MGRHRVASPTVPPLRQRRRRAARSRAARGCSRPSAVVDERNDAAPGEHLRSRLELLPAAVPRSLQHDQGWSTFPAWCRRHHDPCRITPPPPTNDTSVMLTGSGSAAAGATGTATAAKGMARSQPTHIRQPRGPAEPLARPQRARRSAAKSTPVNVRRRLQLRKDMAGSQWSGTRTPTTVGIGALATHPLQATVRIAFRRTPDQGRAGCSQVRGVRVLSAKREKGHGGWLQQAEPTQIPAGMLAIVTPAANHSRSFPCMCRLLIRAVGSRNCRTIDRS
jgi:hypothetical protein